MNMATCSAFSHTSNSEQVMGLLKKTNLLSVLCCFCLNVTVAVDTIRSSQSINDTEYIISNGSAFRLGFFSPENSTNRYLGIWYNNISVFTVIWVANRQKPLKDSSGILTISKEGNLVVLNGQAEIFWSSNVSNSVTNSSATLGDFGNLVLQVDTTGLVLWEIENHPSDSFLPKMKLNTNLRTDQRVQLTSWKSPSDPSIGSFSAGIDALNIPEIFIWKEGHPYWRSGPWNGQVFLLYIVLDLLWLMTNKGQFLILLLIRISYICQELFWVRKEM